MSPWNIKYYLENPSVLFAIATDNYELTRFTPLMSLLGIHEDK